MANPPTIAFVHGAFADSSAWSQTMTALDAAGLSVIAIPNQLRDLDSDAAQVRSVLDTINGPVVLVGHSYGGAVVGEAARGASNVVALVFVAAYILDHGESIATVLDPTRFPGGELGPATTIGRPFSRPGPGPEDELDTDLFIGLEHFANVFAADLPADVAWLMARTQRPLAVRAFTGAAGSDPAWRHVPSWALVAEHDKAIPPAGQRWMAERAGSTVGTIAASHAVMVSQPEAVTATIVEAVASVSA
jgi:pimeloyl-ACP methyl ester carboxylesterase